MALRAMEGSIHHIVGCKYSDGASHIARVVCPAMRHIAGCRFSRGATCMLSTMNAATGQSLIFWFDLFVLTFAAASVSQSELWQVVSRKSVDQIQHRSCVRILLAQVVDQIQQRSGKV